MLQLGLKLQVKFYVLAFKGLSGLGHKYLRNPFISWHITLVQLIQPVHTQPVWGLVLAGD